MLERDENAVTTLPPGAPEARAYTVVDNFRRAVRLYRTNKAIVSETVSYDYGEFDNRTDRLAQALRAQGIGRGDRIAILSGPRPEYADAYIAAAKLGVTLVNLNTRLHPLEQAHCLQTSSPRFLLAGPEHTESVSALRKGCPSLKEIMFLPEEHLDPASHYEKWLAASSAEPPDVAVGPDDIYCVFFTSGTTGRPKGAMISQQASTVRGLRLAQWFGLTEEDGEVDWHPMFHTGADEIMQATLTTGGVYATVGSADPVALFSMIEEHRLTWTALLPGMFEQFVNSPERDDFDLSSLRFAFGYGNMSPGLVRAFCDEFNADFWDAYGQSETSFLLAFDRVRPGQEPSLRKTPTPLMDVRVVDETLREVPDGVPGECVVRGPSVMSGYLEDPHATEDVFRGGWLHTGDVVVRHPDGRISFVDRLKYLIKTGGENVYPAEVEAAILRHSAVVEAFVISVPDQQWGEAIKAIVVPRDGTDISRSEIDKLCRTCLGGFKVPRYVEFVQSADVPRNMTGKVDRSALEARPVTDDQRV